MPVYEYRCPKCGENFELVQKITEEPVKLCPREGCGGEPGRLIPRSGGFSLKGGGWYKDGY